MIKTIHFIHRMCQRGIKFETIQIALELGFVRGDHCVLDRKTALRFLKHLDKLRKSLIDIIDKGGLTIVSDEDRLVTIYKNSSSNHKLKRKK